MSENWLSEHEYFTGDDGQPESDDDFEQVKDTVEHFLEFFNKSPDSEEFELEFRAFMHNDEYSYSSDTIERVLKSLKEKI